jgi:hypothetical protein
MWIALLALILPADLIASWPAPAHNIQTWEGAQASEEGKVQRRSNEFNPDGQKLKDLRGQVVLLVRISDAPKTLVLIADLLKSNPDRDITVLGHAEPLKASEARNLIDSFGLEFPIGLALAGETPYGSTPLAVIGRAGDLVWAGDPELGNKDLIDGLTQALDMWPAAPIELDLPSIFGEALKHYYGGRWNKAVKAAEKAQRKSPEQGALLLEHLNQFEYSLREKVADMNGMKDHMKLAFLDRALQRGWPKCEAAKLCSEQVKQEKKSLGASALLDSQAWAELQDRRPLFFHTRKSSGDRLFERKLSALTRNNNETEVTRIARKLLGI